MKVKIKPILKPLKYFALTIAFTAIAPIVLVKMNYWNTGYTADIKFKDPYPPITSGQGPASYSQAVERAAPAVVSVNTTHAVSQENNPMMNDPFFRYFFGDPNMQDPRQRRDPREQRDPNAQQPPPETRPAVGSGVIVSKDGYILTNSHVVQGAEDIEIKLSDSRTAKAKVVGADPDSDLAILKISLDNLPVIALGNSEKLKVGDVVLAIGNPFGVGQTVTQGIVSATHRTDLGINTFESFIQTDAAINPGNSGGALIDTNGNCIGINNAIFTRTGGYQGIGFAIPIDLAKGVMTELIGTGHVIRGWLGITVRNLSEELRKTLKYPKGEGTVIAGILRGGPANKAGIMPGDIIVSLDNQNTPNSSELLKITSRLKPNTPYNMTVSRDGELHDFKVVIGTRPSVNKS